LISLRISSPAGFATRAAVEATKAIVVVVTTISTDGSPSTTFSMSGFGKPGTSVPLGIDASGSGSRGTGGTLGVGDSLSSEFLVLGCTGVVRTNSLGVKSIGLNDGT
jgi:hypothetical protein